MMIPRSRTGTSSHEQLILIISQRPLPVRLLLTLSLTTGYSYSAAILRTEMNLNGPLQDLGIDLILLRNQFWCY